MTSSILPPRRDEFDAIAKLVEAVTDGPDEWLPEHHDHAEACGRALLGYVKRVRDRQDAPVPSRGHQKPKGGLRHQSPKRAAEKVARDAVRAEVALRDGGVCQGAARGLPGRCGTVPGRSQMEVHEFRQRSTHPGSHLNPDDCALVCPVHHDFCTDASGDDLELVMAVGLLERATDATEHAVRSTKPARSGDR